MKKISGKVHRLDIIFCVVLLALIVMGILLPKTGPLVLMNEACDLLIIWIICIFISIRLIRPDKARAAAAKAWRVTAIVACAVICIWFTKDVVLDMAEGPQRVVLENVEVSHSQAHTGILSSHYYLTGTDPQGKKMRLEISGGDYTDLSGQKTVSVKCYKHTRRVLEIH